MQEMRAEGGPGSRTILSARAPGVLEGTHYIEDRTSHLLVVADGRSVAKLFGVHCAAMSEVEDVKYMEYIVRELLWTRPAALSILQGMSLVGVLGFSIGLTRFAKKKPWDPKPGLTDVHAVVPYENPRGLSPMEVVHLVVSRAV